MPKPSTKEEGKLSGSGPANQILSVDPVDNEVVVLDKEVCPQLVSTDGLLVQQPQHQDTVVQNVHQTEDEQNADDILKNLDEVFNKLLHLVLEFRINVEKGKELKRQYNKVKKGRE